MMKKLILSILLAAVLLPGASARAAGAALIFSSGGPDQTAVSAGFKSAYKGSYKEYNLEGSDEKQRVVGEQLKADKPDVAVVVGDLAAQLAQWYLEGVPVVYVDSIKAAKFGLAGSAAGVYHEPDPTKQLETLNKLFPGKKRVGLLYCPEYTTVDMNALKDKASSLGLSLIVGEVATIKDVPGKVTEIMPKSDVLWVMTDPVVLSSHSTQYIVLQSISAKVPIFCGERSLARGGATAALVPSFASEGKKAGELATAAAAGSVPAGKVVYPEGELILNMKTSKLLSVDFPTEQVISAKEVIN